MYSASTVCFATVTYQLIELVSPVVHVLGVI
jgi:hypothetical protein